MNLNVNRTPFQYRSSNNSLQKAIGKRIKELGINVHDGYSNAPKYPYVKLGDELSSERLMSKETYGEFHNITLYIWSDFPTTMEVKAIGSAIIDVLINSPLPLDDGFCVTDQTLDHSNYVEADQASQNISRGFLYLDFEVADSLKKPI